MLTVPTATVSDAELPEWRSMLDLALKAAPDVDRHLVTHFMLFRDHMWLRKLVAYVSLIFSSSLLLLKLK